jgi:hypothetical protein
MNTSEPEQLSGAPDFDSSQQSLTPDDEDSWMSDDSSEIGATSQ